MLIPTLVLELLGSLALVRASVTVYGQQPIGQTQTQSAGSATYTGYQAYNPTVLIPPPLPSPAPPTQFNVGLQQSAAQVSGISIPVNGSFWGFSIETSVITQVCEFSTIIVVPMRQPSD